MDAFDRHALAQALIDDAFTRMRRLYDHDKEVHSEMRRLDPYAALRVLRYTPTLDYFEGFPVFKCPSPRRPSA
jgi:hypothetical protein